MERHQLIDTQGERRVSAPVVIAEFDLIDSRSKFFDDRADLPAHEPVRRHIVQEGD